MIGQNMNNYGNIGVLMGGVSSERDISLKSGQAVAHALQEEGYHVKIIDIKDKSEQAVVKLIKEGHIDLAFIVLHGRFGEDGQIQSLLDNLHVPYTGSGVLASQLAMNKASTQKLLKNNGILVPDYVSLNKEEAIEIGPIRDYLKGYPLIVKPACEGSSIGVKIVYDDVQLLEGIDQAFNLDNQILIERFIKGREVTVAVLGSKTLPIVEICHKASFFDFDAKYQKGQTEYIVPARLDDLLASHISNTAYKVHCLIGCEGFSRVDFMIDQKNQSYVLELNTIPGFTTTSLLPKAANEIGINFNQLCKEIMDLAYGKKTEKGKVSI